MDRERIYFYFFLILVLFFIFAALLMLLPFAVPIMWAVVIGIVLYPLHRYIERVIKNRTLSALLMSLIVFLFIIVPMSVVSVLVLQQLVDATQRVMLYLQSHSYHELMKALEKSPLIREYYERFSPAVEFIQKEEFRQIVADSLNRILKFLGDKLGQLAFIAGRNLFYIFVFLLTFFFILRDGPGILRRIERLIPMNDEDLESVMGTMYRTILAVVYGSVGTALLQSILALFAYSVVGIKFALLWSVGSIQLCGVRHMAGCILRSVGDFCYILHGQLCASTDNKTGGSDTLRGAVLCHHRWTPEVRLHRSISRTHHIHHSLRPVQDIREEDTHPRYLKALSPMSFLYCMPSKCIRETAS